MPLINDVVIISQKEKAMKAHATLIVAETAWLVLWTTNCLRLSNLVTAENIFSGG